MSSSFKIEKVFDRAGDVMNALGKLATTSALVGIPESKTSRDKGEAVNNATLAYIHENGSDRAHLPPRPFLKPGVEKAKGTIDSHLKAASKAASDGDSNSIDREFNKAGQIAVNSIRGMFMPGNNSWPEVKPATQRAKGEEKTTTLVESGQMRKAITYIVQEDA